MSELTIWDVYVASYISDSDSIWSGPHAGRLPLKSPVHVITAYNPHGSILSSKENDMRNIELLCDLRDHKVKIMQVVGHSCDGSWQEASYAVHGISRTTACKIARRYNQRGIFELTNEELRVINVDDQIIVKRRPRTINE